MEQQYIGFLSDGAEMLCPIGYVREIMRSPNITKIPQTPAYVSGVSNVRGMIISVIDLRALLGRESILPDTQKIIILAYGKAAVGVLVDEITGVIKIDESEMQSTVDILPNGTDMVCSIAKAGDRVVSVIDPRRIMLADPGNMELIEDVREVADVGAGMLEVTKQVTGMGGDMLVKELVTAKEFLSRSGMGSEKTQTYDMVIAFLEAIAAEDHATAEEYLNAITSQGGSDAQLFREVGRVTRKLHDSIKSFKEALDPRLKDMVVSDMPSAIDRLQLVIQKTEEAANKTMGIVENTMLSVDPAESALLNVEKALGGKCSDDVAVLREFKGRVFDGMTEILMTQSFQDLTGQTIKKVITLIGELESELISLVATFGLKIEAEKAPVLCSGSDGQSVSQEGVDQMLSDFGF